MAAGERPPGGTGRRPPWWTLGLDLAILPHRVRRNAIGGQLHEEPGAYVGGQRVTAMPGRHLRHVRMRHREEEEGEGMGSVGAALVWLIVLFALSLGIVQLAPGRTAAAVDTLRVAVQHARDFALGKDEIEAGRHGSAQLISSTESTRPPSCMNSTSL